MANVTYHNQPGINATSGTIQVAGNNHPYTVKKILWPTDIEAWISERIIGTSLHLFCGKSKLGLVRVDNDPSNSPDTLLDIFDKEKMQAVFKDRQYDTVIADPPYNSRFQLMHDMLNELHRIAGKRIIFQHHFSPLNAKGQFKKAHVFTLSESAMVPTMPGAENILVREDPSSDSYVGNVFYWQPRTYFGRVNVITVMDRHA